MKEYKFDKMLNIQTVGDQQGFHQSFHYHRYEATPYSALEVLFNEHPLTSSDRVIDFGCGKGRLNFFVHYFFQSTVIGIEMDETYYKDATKNYWRYLEEHNDSEGKIHFLCCYAQEYEIHPLDNVFYFFNPFSIQIFMNVINNILMSVEKSYRDVELILYYSSEDYIFYLTDHPSFELKQEIRLPGEYEIDVNERFLVYKLAY